MVSKEWRRPELRDEPRRRVIRDINGGPAAVDLRAAYHNGRIDGGRELFGGTSGPPGFRELIAYEGFLTPADLQRATNRQSDGVLTAADAIFPQLVLWTDTNHNGESEESELVSVARAGFTTIYLGYSDKWSKYDGFGNLLHYQGRGYN
jgi:hypothetical protein